MGESLKQWYGRGKDGEWRDVDERALPDKRSIFAGYPDGNATVVGTVFYCFPAVATCELVLA